MISRRTLLTGAAAVAVAPMLPAVVAAEPVIEYLPPSDLLKQMLDMMEKNFVEQFEEQVLYGQLYGQSWQTWLPDAAAQVGVRCVMLPSPAWQSEMKEAGAE